MNAILVNAYFMLGLLLTFDSLQTHTYARTLARTHALWRRGGGAHIIAGYVVTSGYGYWIPSCCAGARKLESQVLSKRSSNHHGSAS